MAKDEWVTRNVSLNISGYPLDLEMTVPANPVKPSRMLPIFHKMANSFADIGVQAVESEGKSISCKAGCGACCRQPVPIAEIEAYQIAELVESMPEPRKRAITKRFESAYEHFERSGWFEEFRREYLRKKTTEAEIMKALDVVLDYFSQGVPCPFLENESCSIHLNRPVSCREYLVTSSAEHCSRPTAKTIDMVPLPIKPTKSLEKLARTDEGRKSGQLLLIQALRYVADHPNRFDEKTGEAWMAEFFNGLIDRPPTAPPPKEAKLRQKKRHKNRR